MKPVVFVIGATGRVGTVTVENLAAKYAERVEIRAGVRNLLKAENYKSLAGISLVQATMGDEKLVKILSGVDTLLIVTPSSKNQAKLAVSTAELAKKADVKHIAVLSVIVADIADSIIGSQFREIEEGISRLGIPYTIIRLPFFTDNYWSFKDTIVKQGVIYCPVDPEKPFTPVAVDDVGSVSAAILVNSSSYANKTISVVSDCQTFTGVVKGFSTALGREIRYVKVPHETAKKPLLDIGLPEQEAEEVLELYKLINTSNPIMWNSDVGVVNQITGDKPTTLEVWLSESFQ
jgi:uncharacterized protein YbjT (DUF2867 family)